MFIKRLKKNIYDVFVGNGWGQWSRVERKDDELEVVAGNKLDRRTINYVKGWIK